MSEILPWLQEAIAHFYPHSKRSPADAASVGKRPSSATAAVVATVELEDTAPEGAAADGKGRIFVNNERKNTIQVIDVKTWKATAS